MTQITTLGAVSASSQGTAVNGGANSKGSWVEFSSSLPHAVKWLLVIIDQTQQDAPYLIDIGVGAAGSEAVVVPDIHIDNNSITGLTSSFAVPVDIASGARLAARLEGDTGTSQQVRLTLIVSDEAPPDLSSIADYTDYGITAGSADKATAIDAGGVAHTKGSWVEIAATVEADAEWIWLYVGKNRNGALTDGEFLVDIGIGAGGAETVAIADVFVSEEAAGDYVSPMVIGPFPADLFQGQRLSARCQSSITDASDRVLTLGAMSLNGTPGAGSTVPTQATDFFGDESNSNLTVLNPGDNTKSGWTEISSSLPHDVELLVLIFAFQGTNNTSVEIFDLGVGPAGSETVLVPNIHIDQKAGNNLFLTMGIPVDIASGTRLAVRSEGSGGGGSETWVLGVLALDGRAADFAPSSFVAYGVNPGSSQKATEIDPGGTANTKGAWVELASSFDGDGALAVFTIGRDDNAVLADASFLFDIGIGAGGAETVVYGNIGGRTEGGLDCATPNQVVLPAAPLQGQRVAVRSQSNIIDATDRVLTVSMTVALQAAAVSALGLASETDTAQALGSAKVKTIGLASEADTAPAATASKAKAVGLASETDTAQALGSAKVKTIGLASEADTAPAATASRTKALALAATVAVALGVTPVKSVAAGLSTETDTAFAVSSSKTKAVGLATEADSAFAVSSAAAQEVGLATETDSALAVSILRTVSAGLASEADTALAVSSSKVQAVGLASEADSAQALTSAKTRAVGLASEADSAFAVTTADATPVALASETDTALAVTAIRARAVGLASEADTAPAVTAIRARAVGLASEADTAPAAIPERAHPVGLASEADTAFAVTTPAGPTVVGLAVETDSAPAVASAKSRAVALASEADSALAVSILRTVSAGLASEADTAPAVSSAKVAAVGLATEADSAFDVAGLTGLIEGHAEADIEVGPAVEAELEVAVVLEAELEAGAAVAATIEVNEGDDVILFRDNDNLYRARNLRDTRTDPDTPLNAATVEGTLYSEDDLGGTPLVASQTMAKVAGTDGLYEATVDKALFPSSGGSAVPLGRHVLRVTATESGLDLQKDIYVEVRDRVDDLRS